MSSTVGATASQPPPGVTPNFENPTDVLHTVAIVTSSLALGIVTLFTAGRFYVRHWITEAFFIEDWFCLASWVLTTASCITTLFSALVGGGYHAWDLTPETMVKFQTIQYSLTIIYGPCVWCIKVALLLILVRVFTPFKRIIWAIWSFIATMLIYNIIATALKVFICTPFEAVWDPTVPGKCLDSYILFSVDTSLSILTDLMILVLPIPLVWSLQVPTMKKIRTIALLGAGGVATSCGIVRLVLILRLNDSPYSLGDQTVSLLRINLLVTAELAIGIICACLPAFNIFFAAEQLRRSQRSRTNSFTNSNSKFPSKSNYTSKASLKLSNLPAPFVNAKLRGTPDGGYRDGFGDGGYFGVDGYFEGRVGELRNRDSYVEIRTPQDIGALLISLKTPEGARKNAWPLRTVIQESYFDLRPGMTGSGG